MDYSTKFCRYCDQFLPRESFYPNPKLAGGLDNMCRPCRSKKSRELRDQYHAYGLCHCGRQPIEGKKTCEWCRERYRAWRTANRQKYLEGHKRIHITNKQKVYDHYGWRCACCGEDNAWFLTIDHINNDGHKHRKTNKGAGAGSSLYLWLVRQNFPEGFQTLCYNCNCGKARNKGICPHKLKVVTPAVYAEPDYAPRETLLQ